MYALRPAGAGTIRPDAVRTPLRLADATAAPPLPLTIGNPPTRRDVGEATSGVFGVDGFRVAGVGPPAIRGAVPAPTILLLGPPDPIINSGEGAAAASAPPPSLFAEPPCCRKSCCCDASPALANCEAGTKIVLPSGRVTSTAGIIVPWKLMKCCCGSAGIKPPAPPPLPRVIGAPTLRPPPKSDCCWLGPDVGKLKPAPAACRCC